jgi:hypothetical protein
LDPRRHLVGCLDHLAGAVDGAGQADLERIGDDDGGHDVGRAVMLYRGIERVLGDLRADRTRGAIRVRQDLPVGGRAVMAGSRRRLLLRGVVGGTWSDRYVSRRFADITEHNNQAGHREGAQDGSC